MDATIVSYQEGLSTGIDIYKAGIPSLYMDGPPGCGKTTMGKYLQQALGYGARFLIKPGHHDVVDFGGVPVPIHATRTTTFYPSIDLLPPSDYDQGVLIIVDELPDSAIPNQNLVCQWLFEGGMHNYRFPDPHRFFVTGNRVADRSGANRVITKLGNRLAWLSLNPTVMELIEYGYSMGWAHSLLAFLRARGANPINLSDKRPEGEHIPTYFNSFDPTDPAQIVKPVFASSRSIEFVSNLINYIDREKRDIPNGELITRVAALTGTPWASSYVPFRREALLMPDPDAILRGDRVPFPKQESILWTLTVTLVSKATKNTWKHLWKFLKQGPAEYWALAIRLAFDNHAAKLVGDDFNATLQEPEVQQILKAR